MNTDLETVQRAQGAQFAVCDGVSLPVRFAGLEKEWNAVRRGCGLLDARFRALLRMTGSDRTTFLQGMVTNDVGALTNGQGTYAALLTIQGHLVSDLRVYTLADEIWLDIPRGRADAVRTALAHYVIADDVEFAGGEDWAPLIALEGPASASVLQRIWPDARLPLAPFGHCELRLDGTALRVAATSHTGESGYLFFGSAENTARLWERCSTASAEPVGMDALNVLRLEAGVPWFGCDMDEHMLISEVGLESAISYRKGCYLGQEVVERVAARGQVHRKLVGLTLAVAPPPRGSKLERDGKEVGWITSAAWSPARRTVVALGYLGRGSWDPGVEVQVRTSAGLAPAKVEPLPFYAR